jgi:hypothetical protein
MCVRASARARSCVLKHARLPKQGAGGARPARAAAKQWARPGRWRREAGQGGGQAMGQARAAAKAAAIGSVGVVGRGAEGWGWCSPSLMPKLSSMTLASGARQLRGWGGGSAGCRVGRKRVHGDEEARTQGSAQSSEQGPGERAHLVVHEALEMMWSSLGLYLSWLTPITNIGASADGALMMTCARVGAGRSGRDGQVQAM